MSGEVLGLFIARYLATLENTLFAFPPIKYIVPMIMMRITASKTAYSAVAFDNLIWPHRDTYIWPHLQ